MSDDSWRRDPEGFWAAAAEEIDRVLRRYPEWHDAAFIEEHLPRWLA